MTNLFQKEQPNKEKEMEQKISVIIKIPTIVTKISSN
jgi:hypothetical protein